MFCPTAHPVAKGMVMTGIEIVVGGICHNQCNTDGGPLATYGTHCSPLQTEGPTTAPPR